MRVVAWALAVRAAAKELTASDMVRRDFDVLTREPVSDFDAAFEELFHFPHFPAYMGVAPADSAAGDDVYAPMSWRISRTSGSVQLARLAPLDVVYTAQHNGAVGETWRRHLDALAALVAARGPFRRVLEVGGGRGDLALRVLERDPGLREWVLVDPNAAPRAPDARLAVDASFFDAAYVSARVLDDVDAVVHSHVLEHMYDPHGFVELLQKSLRLGALQIFSLPDLDALLARGAPCLHFEHTALLGEAAVDAILAAHGFATLEKRRFGDGHSLFYVARLASRAPVPPPPVAVAKPADRAAAARAWRDGLAGDARGRR